MIGARRLIVNADDFGLSAGVNAGVIKTHIEGIVTSASLMVRQPAAAEAAALSREHATLSVGLHLDFGEWYWQDGSWNVRYGVVDLDDAVAVAAEARRQLQAFRDLIARDPTHLDSHQHVHRREPVLSGARALARELNVPLRHVTPGVRYRGEFYGQTAEGVPLRDALSVRALVRIIDALPAGTTELVCHPAQGIDCETTYGEERTREVETLCDPAVRDALAIGAVALHSFAQVSGRLARIGAA